MSTRSGACLLVSYWPLARLSQLVFHSVLGTDVASGPCDQRRTTFYHIPSDTRCENLGEHRYAICELSPLDLRSIYRPATNKNKSQVTTIWILSCVHAASDATATRRHHHRGGCRPQSRWPGACAFAGKSGSRRTHSSTYPLMCSSTARGWASFGRSTGWSWF